MTEATAVVAVDLQNMYLDQDKRDLFGWPPIWEFDRVIAECALLFDHCRSAGIPIIYTRQVARADGADATPSMVELARRHGSHDSDSPVGSSAEWGSQILDAVKPHEGDIVIEKRRWDSFFNTDLAQILRNLGARRLVVAGLQTNVCVETTARTAMMMNFDVAVPEDAVSTDGRDLHFAALNSLRVLYAEVAPWRELLAPEAHWERRYQTKAYGRS